eukprot:GSChrysophyteH2.ASY1.ANO1.1212.1 assembled CDS
MVMDSSQLAELERLCTIVYAGTEPSAMADAEQQLTALRTTIDFVPQCQFILDHSESPYAQLLAAQSLETLVTKFWANFTNEQRIEMRNYILGYLTSKPLQKYVLNGVTKCCCRITKLGWFDCVEQRAIIGKAQLLMEEHANSHEYQITMTAHRKTAVSFRDQGLYQAFQIAVDVLHKLQLGGNMASNPQLLDMCNLALQLAANCLTFDFIGTNPEDSADDVGTVQVPTAWRPVIQNTKTVQMFFDLYENTEPPNSNLCLQALVQLSAVRRSLFSGETERTEFLHTIMGGIYNIMLSKKGLDEEENYHEFCRMLGRLKASYQLSELVKTPRFSEWLKLAADFTIISFRGWENCMNSIHYLLALWGRMVAALPYLRSDSDEQQAINLRECVLQVTNSFIQTMVLDSTQAFANGSADDPMDDEGSLREIMDRLPSIARLHYSSVAIGLCSLWQENLQVFQSVQAGYPTPQGTLAEYRLTWLVHITASVIGGPSSHDARKGGSDDLIIDARLSQFCFILCDAINTRLKTTNGQHKVTVKLELAMLQFFKSFKKIYLLDNLNNNSGLSGSVVGSPIGNHPLLSLALSYGSTPDVTEPTTIFEAMGAPQLKDAVEVMNLVVDKVCNNIKFWHDTEQMLEETLTVFVELVSSYGSSKTLLSLDTVKFLIHNHVGQHFPFLGYDNDNKHRVTFYSAMARLVFSSSEDLDNVFDAFIEPNLQILQQLSVTADFREPSARRTYILLFEALYPSAFPLLNRIAETLADDPVVMTALLKFMQEFVQNRASRITFEQSSANGILLFRETSTILCAYGSRILTTPAQKDVYREKYKGIRLMLNTLMCSLGGGYVNFGVFTLYNDRALQDALDVALQMVLQIPSEDVLAYTKLSKAYYGVLEIFFRQHLDVLSGLEAPVFLQLVKANHEGLQSSDLQVVTQCASAIDHIATYIFLNQNRPKTTVQRIMQHLETEPECFMQLLSTLFNSLLFASAANYWPLTRPILSLILVSESCYNEFQKQLLASQTVENQQKLTLEFSRLTDNLQRSLEVSNRDKFTQRLTVFRSAVRSFMNL